MSRLTSKIATVWPSAFLEWLLAVYVCGSFVFLLLVASIERLQTHWAFLVAIVNILGSTVALLIYLGTNNRAIALKKREPFQQLAFWGALLFFKAIYNFYLYGVFLLLYVFGMARILKNEQKTGSALSIFQTFVLFTACAFSAFLTFRSPLLMLPVLLVVLALGIWRISFFLKNRAHRKTVADQ